MEKKPRVVAVVAIGKNRELGKDNDLLWHIPDDLKRFKQLTLGHPVVMGRKTFESIVALLGKPLPGRANIVVTRDESWTYPNVVKANSLERALELASVLDHEEVHIGGGAQLYAEALPHIDRLYLTLIDDEKPADTFFPEYEKEFTKVLSREEREHEGLRYTWLDLERP